ncbi:DUF58 domain-containing protein [Zavarzinella formosa]|uniref:DUF58 domain-containing protein n=1 Tax=Zavarzinella formosa TaxID=360055 RepID=UPI00030A7327|nr:DUF58 domain-containing protein [Zavarzinella formosa]
MTLPSHDPKVYTSLEQLVGLRHQASGFVFLPRQPVRSLLAGGHASKLRGRGLDFEEIRKYVPGDDPRAIDWRVTARTRQPHTRVYTEERERPVLLLVDQRLGMFFGSVLLMKSVVAAQAAALTAWRTVAVKDRVGAIVFNDTQITDLRPQRTTPHVTRLLQLIVDQNQSLRADADTPPNPGQLNEVLKRAVRLATHDHLIVLISDATGADADTRKWLTAISHHNDVLVMFVEDPLESDLPAIRRGVVTDGTQELELDFTASALRTRFRDEHQERRQTARRFLLSREVPVMPLRTDSEVVGQIRRQLGARPRVPHA